jgi:hypothetical protein
MEAGAALAMKPSEEGIAQFTPTLYRMKMARNDSDP